MGVGEVTEGLETSRVSRKEDCRSALVDPLKDIGWSTETLRMKHKPGYKGQVPELRVG